MEIIEYQIQQGDTLESIAEKYNITVEELVDYHNQHCGITQQVIGSEIPFHINSISINKDWLIGSIDTINEIEDYQFFQNFIYRAELTVATKLENAIIDNTTYKSQYNVKLDQKRNFVSVILDENHVFSSPELVQKGMELIADIDKIKCNSIFQISQETGEIIKILNYDEIIKNWNRFKSKFNSTNSVMNLSKTQQDIHDFITTVESLIIPEKNLIRDYDTKMFYDVFFNQFLVGKGDFSEGFSKTFYSTIFDQQPVSLNFTSSIIEENEDVLKVRRVSSMNLDSLNLEKIIKLYDERIKPSVKYNFYEYKYSFRETLIWNKKENILQDSHITVIEEVKNNVQLLIDFNLKLIE